MGLFAPTKTRSYGVYPGEPLAYCSTKPACPKEYFFEGGFLALSVSDRDQHS